MRLLRGFLVIAVQSLCATGTSHAVPTHALVHSFAIPPSSPIGELVQAADGNYYGTTSTGGVGGCGTVFKMTSGGVLTTLVEFTGNGVINKGARPGAGLIQGADGNLYGTTAKGGENDCGTVFRVTTAGSLTTLVEFTNNGPSNKGATPYASLLQASNGNFYGTTSRGGSKNLGTVFTMTPTGQLSTLVEFTGTVPGNKGAWPYAPLIQGTDGNLYGTTASGGDKGNGTVFKMTPGGVLTTLVLFTENAATNKGASPYGGLVQGSGGDFFGTTAQGGTKGFGTVFKMTPSGVLTTLANFTGNSLPAKGAAPESALLLGTDGSLYGTTFGGGPKGYGTIFKITTAGVLTTLVEFTGNGTTNIGSTPQSGLIRGTDGRLYGTTFGGGGNDTGTVFRMTTAGTLTTLAEFPAVNLDAYSQAGLVLGSDGNFYGTRSDSGAAGNGTVFRVTPDGAIATVVEFTGNGAANRGAHPFGTLVRGSDGSLYGTTADGGTKGFGTVFNLALSGVLSTLVDFSSNGSTNKGATPAGSLVEGTDGNFYGTTAKGGANDVGTVFKMTPAGVLSTLVEFTGNAGSRKGGGPFAPLLQGADGNFYGTTAQGGAKGYGTIFKMTPTGTLTTLVEFADSASGVKGAYPYAGLILGSDGNFYGTTATGGATGDGTIFKVTPAGLLTTLVEFTGTKAPAKGAYPQGGLFQGSDGNFYGTTGFGGKSNFGTVFQVTPGGVLTTLVEFTGNGTTGKGASPYATLITGVDGNLYGTTALGGTEGSGTAFGVRIRAFPATISAGNVQTDVGSLNAVVTPGGLPASIAFEYGTTTNYGTVTTSQAVGNGAGPMTLAAALSGLLPNTTYHFRLVITDSSGTLRGADQTFTTEPLSTEVISTGDTIASEPATTAALNFGVPTIDDNHSVVVLANLSTAAGKDFALLAGSPPAIVVRKSQLAPNADGSTTAGRVFTAFSDPVCDSAGQLAFTAKILDGGVRQAGLWSNAGGTLKEVARVGGDVAGVAGAKFKAISSFAISNSGQVCYVGTIAGGGASATSDMGLWAFDSGGNHLLLREGDLLDGAKVSAFNVISPVIGSVGQGRSHHGNAVSAQVTFTNKTQAVVNFSPGVIPEVVASTGDPVASLVAGNQLVSFGAPTISTGGTSAFLANLLSGVGGVTAFNNQVILADSSTANLPVVARKGDSAPGAPGTAFSALANPVYNAQSITAFLATLSGAGVTPKNNTGVWWTAPTGLALIARAGAEPPGVPGAIWASFTSLALPDNTGPVFLAKLAAGTGGARSPSGVNVTNNIGVWAMGSAGDLRLIVRTGDILRVGGQPKTLSLINILEPVLGSPGQGRSYNHASDLVFRATFTDRTQAVMRVPLP